MQPNSVRNQRWLMKPRSNSYLGKLKQGMCTVAVSLLVAVVFVSLLTGCASHPVQQVTVYRPPAELMTPAPTQYLLPENLQRNAR